MNRYAVLAAAMLMGSTPALAECTAADASVKVTSVENESDLYYRFTGELVNRCAQPVGIHVRFSAYDKEGRLIGMSEPWPASVRNIAANSSEPFSISAMRYRPTAKAFDAKVIEVKQWSAQ